jgi:hypothetical protein
VAANTPSGVNPKENEILRYVYGGISLFALVLVYLIYRATLLIDHAAAGINAKSYFVTHVLTVFFEVVLWVLIARVAVRFKLYARAVMGGDDGRALNYGANALLLSLPYAMLFGMASTVKTLFMHSSSLSMVTTITNLVPLVVILVATALLFVGTLKLRHTLPMKYQSLPPVVLIKFLVAYVVVVGGFTAYFYNSAPKLLDDDGLHHFTWSASALLFLYALPYAVVWLLGLLASLNLARYSSRVPGKIYKPLFRGLYRGLVTSFAGTYLVQVFYVTNFTSNSLSVGLLMLITILALLIYGCIMIYRGTNQLYLLEK